MKDATAVLNAMQQPISELAQWINKLVSPVEDLSGQIGAWLARIGVVPSIVGAGITVLKTLTMGLLALGLAFGVKAIGGFIGAVFRVVGVSYKGAPSIATLRNASTAANGAMRALAPGNTSLAVQASAAGAASLRSAAA